MPFNLLERASRIIVFANEKKGECRGDSEIQKEVLVVTGEGNDSGPLEHEV